MQNGHIWVEPVGSVIVARLRGKPTAELILECEARVLELTRDTRHVRVLYDALELEPPEMALVLLQKQLDSGRKESIGAASLRTAIVVPNTKIAYLSRIAWGHVGESDYRVFYNDLSTALSWLDAKDA